MGGGLGESRTRLIRLESRERGKGSSRLAPSQWNESLLDTVVGELAWPAALTDARKRKEKKHSQSL